MICPRLARSLRVIFSAVAKNANLVEVNRPFADQDRGASDPGRLNNTIFLFRTSDQCTRPPHLNSLGDSPTETAVAVLAVVSQKPSESTISAASSWVFRNSAQGREHPSTNVKTVGALRVKIYIWHDVLGGQSFKSPHVDA